MKLVHFKKLALAQKAVKEGISSTKNRRLNGVYCVPILDFPATAINNWKRALSSERNRTRMGAVIFEIPDREMLYFSPDWSHTALGSGELVTAREAEGLTFALGREHAKPLTPRQFQTMMAMCEGTLLSEVQPHYDFGMMEIIVPRAIKPKEVIRVILPPNKKKDWPPFSGADVDYELDDN